MKTYIASNSNLNKADLSAIVKKIIKIEVVDDARNEYCVLSQMPQSLFADEDIDSDPEYDQQETDMWYLGFSDEELSKLNLDTIHKFQNTDLLIRIGRINKNLLSEEQRRYLENTLSTKNSTHDKLTDKDINYMLQLIRDCNDIRYDYSHIKTNEFTFDKNKQFRKNAVLRVLKGLKFEDWKYKTRSVNYRYLGNTLFIFDPDVVWKDQEGNTKYLRLYIKLDVQESLGIAIALVSFHEYGET